MAGFLSKLFSAPRPATEKRDPQLAAESRARGNAALSAGNLDEAASHYGQAIAADPADPQYRLNLGYVLIMQGEARAAETALEIAVSMADPSSDTAYDAHYLLADLKRGLGDEDAGLTHLEAAAAKPGFVEPLRDLVDWRASRGRADQALDAARRWANAAPSAESFMSIARSLQQLGRHADALEAIDTVLAQEPGHPVALEGRGTMLLSLNRPREALAAFEAVLALESPKAHLLSNMAAALDELDDYPASLHYAERALAIDPNDRNAIYNRSYTLCKMLHVDESMALAARGLALYPEDADLHWLLGIGHMLKGELLPGWLEFEWRQRVQQHGQTPGLQPDAGVAHVPRWSGQESLAGKHILLFAEEGFGDTLQFLRYVPQVAALAARVTVQVQPPLLRLANGLATNVVRQALGSDAGDPDYQCSLMSLPLAFGTSLDKIPAVVPYLRADPAQVSVWQEKLAQLPGLKVGLVWSGNPRHRNDRKRSLSLEGISALQAPGCTFITLQPDVRESDREALAKWPALKSFGAQMKDFSDTAALVTSLDLVITVDTSVAHLAGALGKPVWILLPHCPDWRWMLDREDSPWYPTARLWRQPAAGDWASVLAQVREALEAESLKDRA